MNSDSKGMPVGELTSMRIPFSSDLPVTKRRAEGMPLEVLSDTGLATPGCKEVLRPSSASDGLTMHELQFVEEPKQKLSDATSAASMLIRNSSSAGVPQA
jgi:hypothetical protein